jgi:hypothetical protein
MKSPTKGLGGHTTYCGSTLTQGNRISGAEADNNIHEGAIMNSADKLHKPMVGPELSTGQDQLAEEILSNMTNTPVGRLLKVIAAPPEIRQDKVDQIKLELTSGTYDLDENLDVALDAILEELMMR